MGAGSRPPRRLAGDSRPLRTRKNSLFRVLFFAALALGGAWLSWTRLIDAGFLAVSDDDYSRVVLAQRFAEAPTLDPSGTSWLPAPFWLYGGAMLATSASLEVARGTALFLGLGSVLLLYRAALLLRLSPATAALAVLAVAWLPTARPLAVSTIPEFPTHALAGYALIAVAVRRDLAAAGLALFVATLSRYEIWPLAATAALLASTTAPGSRRRRLEGALFALGATAGPLLWCVHGYLHHGSATFFVKRVVEYKAALGEDPRSSLELLSSFPRALVTVEPEALFLGGFSLLLGRRLLRAEPELRVVSVLLPLVAMVAFLALGDYRGGAPTHHAERTLLVVWMLALLLAGFVLERAPALRKGTVVGAALLAAWPLRASLPSATFGPRPEEEAVGRLLRERFPPAERFVVATTDYGYFAVLAAAGRPSRFTVLETHDPRHREIPLPIPPRVVARARETGACHAVLPLCVEMPGIRPLEETGSFSIARLTRDDCGELAPPSP